MPGCNIVLYRKSRYTLAEPWPDGRGILVNAFSGAVDIVPGELVEFVRAMPDTELDLADPRHQTLIDRGYYVESAEVEDAVARIVGRRAKEQALKSSEVKYMFALTLKCNLSCSYCWQVIEHGNKRQRTPLMTEDMVEAAFRFIDHDMKERNKSAAFISLFGGEPLIDRPEFHQLVKSIGDRTKARGLHLHFTTNGRQLRAFEAEVRRYAPSMQVTVDGVEFTDGRPVLTRAGQKLHGLYESILDFADRLHARIFLRFLLNESTVQSFVGLADVILARTDLKDALTLAVAPLQNKSSEIDSAIPPKFRVLSGLFDALKDRDYAHRISYVDWRSLNLFSGFRLGEDVLPSAGFYHCEANLDLTCFDQNGALYACYEGIGDPQFAVGSYWPKIQLDQDHLDQYRKRSAFSMPECTSCAMSPICGGGCEVRGYKKNGTYMHPYCDDLHAEASMVLRDWPRVFHLLTGTQHDA
jgi:uncharacterized protein